MVWLIENKENKEDGDSVCCHMNILSITISDPLACTRSLGVNRINCIFVLTRKTCVILILAEIPNIEYR